VKQEHLAVMELMVKLVIQDRLDHLEILDLQALLDHLET
jgi:hypothetical protein